MFGMVVHYLFSFLAGIFGGIFGMEEVRLCSEKAVSYPDHSFFPPVPISGQKRSRFNFYKFQFPPWSIFKATNFKFMKKILEHKWNMARGMKYSGGFWAVRRFREYFQNSENVVKIFWALQFLKALKIYRGNLSLWGHFNKSEPFLCCRDSEIENTWPVKRIHHGKIEVRG